MITKEHYDKFIQYRDVLKLFYDTGQYVGGCDTLFDYMKIADKNCMGCKSAALIEAYNAILLYEKNM